MSQEISKTSAKSPEWGALLAIIAGGSFFVALAVYLVGTHLHILML